MNDGFAESHATNTIMEHPSMPMISLSSDEVLQLCEGMQCVDDLPTLFIASYPKSGTTWMQTIVLNLLTEGDREFQHISQYAPFFEIEKTWDLPNRRIAPQYTSNHELIKWRIFNTHLRWEMMPKGHNFKYIYIIRSGQDCAYSFYQHLSHQDDDNCYQGTFEEFVRDWCDGKIIFGNWAEHINSWINSRDAYNSSDSSELESKTICDGKVLLLRYEDLLSDTEKGLKVISKFLGLHHLTDDRLHDLAQNCSFDYMRAHQQKFQPISVPWKDNFSFIRKGVVGDGEQHFGPDEKKMFEEMIKRCAPLPGSASATRWSALGLPLPSSDLDELV